MTYVFMPDCSINPVSCNDFRRIDYNLTGVEYILLPQLTYSLLKAQQASPGLTTKKECYCFTR